MRFVLDEEVGQKLEKICRITNKYPLDVINQIVADYVRMFENKEKQVVFKKAMLFSNKANGGKQVPIGECYVLKEIMLVGQPYYKIFYDGNIMKVPKECIRVME